MTDEDLYNPDSSSCRRTYFSYVKRYVVGRVDGKILALGETSARKRRCFHQRLPKYFHPARVTACNNVTSFSLQLYSVRAVR